MNRDDPIVGLSIKQWTDKFGQLYKHQDSYRLPEHFWTAVMAHVSVIGEEIRKLDYYEILKASSNVFCWLCSYVAKCNVTEDPIFRFKHSLSEIVSLKYPNQCGHCEAKPCRCNPYEMDKDKDKAAKYKNLYDEWQKPSGYPEWSPRHFIDMFWSLFSGNIHIQPLDSIGFHLLEEAGEEAQAVRQLTQFRGVLKCGVKGIDNDFLERITRIPDLVEEYDKSITELKKIYNKTSEKEAKESIDLTSMDPEVVSARLVLAKMDFVIEMADTFSWFCAVLLKVENALRKIKKGEEEYLEKQSNIDLNNRQDNDFENEVYFEEALCKRYSIKGIDDSLTCYACHQTKCKCQFFPNK